MSKLTPFSVEIPVGDEEKMQEFQAAMDALQDDIERYIRGIATELGLEHGAACDIYYLRTRSRWTQDLEDRCVRAMKAGHSLPVLSGEESEELERLGF